MELAIIGNRIRQARESAGITQEELANQLGKSQNAISDYENARRAIRITELPRLAEALGVSVAYFFGEDHPEWSIQALLSKFSTEQLRDIELRLLFELSLQKQAK